MGQKASNIRILNIELRTWNEEIGWIRVFIRIFISALFSILLWNICTAQPLQKTYEGLEKANSLYVTQNSIYIVEQGNNRLLKLDHEGELLEAIGGKGSGNYQFSKPVDVDATNGLKVFVTDFNNRRVQVFDRRGQYLSSISASDAFGNNRPYNPSQVAVNGLGEVFFVDEGENYIRRFDLDSNLLDEFRIPSQIKAVNELNVTSREILILDKETATIHRLALNGSYQGFYAAEGVRALFANERGWWYSTAKELVFESRNKERQTFSLYTELKPVDIHISDQTAFILTANELFKMMISE